MTHFPPIPCLVYTFLHSPLSIHLRFYNYDYDFWQFNYNYKYSFCYSTTTITVLLCIGSVTSSI